MIHGDNFQALNLLQERYREQVKCVYIDPPYNTGDDGFLYKNAYQAFILDNNDQESHWLNIARADVHKLTVVIMSFSIDEKNVSNLVNICLSMSMLLDEKIC